MTTEEIHVQNMHVEHVVSYRKKKQHSKTMHVKANNKFLGDSRNSCCHSTISWKEKQMRAEDVKGKIFY